MGRKMGSANSSMGRKRRPTTSQKQPPGFREFAQHFLDLKKEKLSPATQLRLRSRIARLTAFFEARATIEAISEAHVRDFVQQRRRNTTPGSLRQELGDLKRILQLAVEEGIIDSNPALNVTVPRERVETHSLTPDELRHILESCKPWLAVVARLAAATALSRADLLRLKWQDVEENGSKLRVRSKGKVTRVIPLNNLAKDALRAARSQSAHKTGPIFRGKSISSTNVSQAFMRACRAAGVTAKFRDLRHTAGTFIAANGIGIETVSELMGYANASAAARYFRNDRSQLTTAVKAIDFMVSSTKKPNAAKR